MQSIGETISIEGTGSIGNEFKRGKREKEKIKPDAF
jgi:hypothetical protein